jgi:hypothetical protein
MNKIFPSIIIGMSFGAAIVYAVKGDSRQAIYWFSAAVLNAAVTY